MLLTSLSSRLEQHHCDRRRLEVPGRVVRARELLDARRAKGIQVRGVGCANGLCRGSAARDRAANSRPPSRRADPVETGTYALFLSNVFVQSDEPPTQRRSYRSSKMPLQNCLIGSSECLSSCDRPTLWPCFAGALPQRQ